MIRRVFDTAAQLSGALAETLARGAGQACVDRTALMLAGGRTPLDAYRIWAKTDTFTKTAPLLFLSDERAVLPGDAQSNAGGIAPLFEAAGLPPARFLRVDTARGLVDAAAHYHSELSGMLASGCHCPLGLLGLGADGHTASLFSLDDVARAEASDRLAVPVERPAPPHRISVTPALLERIGRILVVATGAEKADITRRLLETPEALPAGFVLRRHAAAELWMDRAAAG
jgi:6-phosphogluconolactonase